MGINRLTHLFIFFLFLTSVAVAQTTSVSGIILQKNNHQPAPVNVLFTGDFASGTLADSLGRFSIRTKNKVYSISVFSMGYDTVVIPIETGANITELIIYVEEVGIEQKGHTFRYNGDQGEKLID